MIKSGFAALTFPVGLLDAVHFIHAVVVVLFGVNVRTVVLAGAFVQKKFIAFHFFPFFAFCFFGCLMFLSPGRVTGGFMLPLLVTMPMVVISASSIPGRRR
jgi:hypothetical protein